jgi:hypothetical protein
MTGSGDRSSWTTDTSSPSREMGQHKQAHGQVISFSSFEGRFNPTIYLAWELEVEQVLSHHDFSKHERVRACTETLHGKQKKIYTHARSIKEMHSNKRGECLYVPS